MGLLSPIKHLLIKEIVRQAMKTFFNDYATKALAFIAVIFVGIAWLMGKASVEQFMTAALGSAGIVGARSAIHAFANGKNNHSQGVPNAPGNGNSK